MKKLIRRCPFLILLASMGILFSLIGLGGRNNIYEGQEYDPLKKPVLSAVFTAMKEGIYPWQIFDQGSAPVMALEESSGRGDQADRLSGESDLSGQADTTGEETMALSGGEEGSAGASAQGGAGSQGSISGNSLEKEGAESKTGADREEVSVSSGEKAAEQFVSGNQLGKRDPASGTKTESPDSHGGSRQPQADAPQIPQGRLEPLRESTREEYLNHISADIYGDAGVMRAAQYEFSQVDESYFDDALFIGDSRVVGLRDYTDLSEHADFYCETSLTIQKMLKENFSGKGTVEEALSENEYGKIYIMSGINELGVGTTENFMEQYTQVVDTIRAAQPQAKIFIQGIMRVTGKKNSSDAIFNNSNINARNNAIATLADNKQIFYIDVNEAVCDEEGNLNAEYTFDQLHLLGKYNDLWKQFLMAHGAVDAPPQD